MNDIVYNKIAIIENCLKRINEEYLDHEKELDLNFTKQDSIILNLQRACEASIDLGTHIIRLKKMGVPQTSRDVFIILNKENVISLELSNKLQSMVGFRNIAVHDYQKINLAIIHSILEKRLLDFTDFTKAMIKFIKNTG